MVLGLILIALGALAIIAAVGTVDGSTELLGVGIGDLTLFLIGVGSGVALLLGFSLTKWGTKRSLRHRRESKRLGELSEKLDRQEAERREEDGNGAERSF
ncbi:hypothetical protein [Nocardioides mangrovi]|uniref:LapA family protein n=1 Tax=Nocardioides mangrovi TaxID=2874580 RepID=A0ABS7UEN3_9ACTN|nr:hypothetical protein [Nocardioides mangrovi]MBZ5739107.1 hypothetical protein [Nocardioides mangrovi]